MPDYIHVLENKLAPGFIKIILREHTCDSDNSQEHEQYNWVTYKAYKVLPKDSYYIDKINSKLTEFYLSECKVYNCPSSYAEKIIKEVLNELVETELPKEAITISLDTKEISKYIKQVRKEQKLTQVELAWGCNVSLRFIQDIEKGKQACEIGKVLHVLRMLGIKLFARIP
jgi:y4mF family transcriptional regulator